MMAAARIQDHLQFLYGKANRAPVWRRLEKRLGTFQKEHPQLATGQPPLTERDVFLITYGDQVAEPGRPPLRTLAEFLEAHVAEVISAVHLLPYFPYSSDDGFSVIDYRRVARALGNWTDVTRLGRHFRLMFDGVINHISPRSAWFQAFLRGENPYAEYFIVVEPSADLSQVVRPRALPLLTTVATARGPQHVWTTFSDDQIDLNFKNPAVLLEIIDVLLFYVAHGAAVIRLDAIAYLWKEIGTPCIHLPQTHRVVKLFRAVLDAVAPGVLLITETNVPHADNVSYFGDGTDEAQMVYNFALPPLILHTFRTGNARALTEWAATLTTPSPTTTFFNFIASHDGLGVLPARGLLSEADITALVEQTVARGGKVSARSLPDGSSTPYELNITLFDALSTADDPLAVRRFLASQFIMLSLAGVPGIYFHSLFGSRNWEEGLAQTGRARTINRQKFDRRTLETELAQATSLKRQVFDGYRQLLRARCSHPSFHPHAPQRIVRASPGVWALVRGDNLLALANVTDRPQAFRIELPSIGAPAAGTWRDLISGTAAAASQGVLSLTLTPYETRWLAVA